MQYATDAEPALLQPPFCCDCKHYEAGADLCHKGVHYGRAIVSCVSAHTMRSDSWWGNESCGTEGKYWEERK